MKKSEGSFSKRQRIRSRLTGSLREDMFMIRTYGKRRFIAVVAAILVMALIMINSGLTEVYGASAKPAKPKIVSLKSVAVDSFKVTSSRNAKVTGYQIKYSLKKDFSNSKKITVKGTKLNRTVKGLKGGKKYFVRIRAYKATAKGKVYSNWSAWKSVPVTKNENSAEKYMTSVTTNVYTKANASSAGITLWYNTRFTLLSSVTSSKSGTWYKIRYNDKIYYLWDKTKSPEKFTDVNAVKSADEYIAGCSTDLQKEILAKAFDIYNNWDTSYDVDSSYSKQLEKKNGKYLFHCSGYISYIYNTVLCQYAPPFEVSSKTDALADTGYVINEGLRGQIRGTTICSGTIDRSKLQPGDIVCFKLMENDKRKIDHVGIYIGNGQIIQSSRVSKGMYFDNGCDPDGGVCIAPLNGMYKEGFIKAIRILPAEVLSADKEMTATTVSHVFSDKNCEEVYESNALHSGDKVKVLFTYRTSSGKHNAYIAYGENYEKYGYLYLFEGKLN